MALVKCPECGKENISDTAAACPVCGFGIAEYFEMQHEKESLALKKQEALSEAQARYEKELHNIENMKCPYKPSFISILTQGSKGIVSTIAGVCAIIFAVLGIVSICIDIDNLSDMLLYWCIIFVFGAIAYINIKDSKRQCDSEINRIDNWESYKDGLRRAAKQQNDASVAYIEKTYVYTAKKPVESVPVVAAQPKPTGLVCPVCGSRNVKRIDVVSRAISVELAGLASSKIGKQYECKSCKHKW